MFQKLKRITFLLTLTVSFAAVAAAQIIEPTLPVPPPATADLPTILTEAGKQTINYQETFRDLLAIETKSVEEYDKRGDLEEESVVESNFFVYQSSKDARTSTELRNVIKVDGKLIPDSQERANRFAAELEKAKTVEKELEKISDESLRYDKTVKIEGFTLFEAITLAENLRPFFDFKLLGTEQYDGKTVYVVSYQQTRKSPFISVNEKKADESGIYTDIDINVPGDLKKADKFLRGKLWIDAQTFQIRREERQLTVQSARPIVAQETVFEYADSEFGILVPRRITFFDNNIKRPSKEADFAAVKNARIVLDYSNFRRTNVDVQIIDEP